jgi:hypothetical protein
VLRECRDFIGWADERGLERSRLVRLCIAAETFLRGQKPESLRMSSSSLSVTLAIGRERIQELEAEVAPSRGPERPRTACSSHGAYRDRTGDLRLAKPALSQLS